MSTNRMRDPELLKAGQYRDSSRLDARVAFWRRYGDGDENRWPRWVFDRLEIPDEADVLEVGCGPGSLWVAIADRVPKGWAVTLSDLSDGMLAEAQSRHAGLDLNFDYCRTSVDSLPFGDESFDAVIANHMLYHVPDIDAALTEIARVLRPGGRLHTATNSGRHIQEIKDLHRRFDLDPDARDQIEESEGLFRAENGGELLERYFSSVEFHSDESILKVDEAESLMRYLLSIDEPMDEAGAEAHIRDVIERDGAFPVTRSAGMFVAMK